MDYLLFTLALAILLSAGAGITLVLARDREMLGPAETAALSFLYGTAFISLTSFLLGFFLTGLQLRLTVSIFAAGLGVLGLLRFRKPGPVRLRRPRGREWLWIAILCVQSLIVVWVSVRLSLGFDGLFLWEAKARLIFQSGGGMPLDYLRADPSEIPHPDYPLLLPFTESWFYGFLGRPHQGWLKLVLPLFYFSGIGLLARNRLGKSYLPAVMLFFVPVLIIRSTSGEADFPLGVFYLAASLFLLDYLRTGNERLLFIAGTLAALLPWVKREGWILFTLLMIVGAARLVQKREIRNLLVLAGPGVLWIGFWKLFLAISGARTHEDYLPATFTTLAANIDRLPVIAARGVKGVFQVAHLEYAVADSTAGAFDLQAIVDLDVSGCRSRRGVCGNLRFLRVGTFHEPHGCVIFSYPDGRFAGGIAGP